MNTILTSLEYAQTFPTPHRINDAVLRTCISGASLWVENSECGTEFARQVHDEVLSGNGRNNLQLNYLPVETLVSGISVDILYSDGSHKTFTDDWFRIQATTGEIQFASSAAHLNGEYEYFPTGFKNVTIHYVGGYSPIPIDVQEATVLKAITLATPFYSSDDAPLPGGQPGSYQYGHRASTFTFGMKDALAKQLLTPYKLLNRSW